MLDESIFCYTDRFLFIVFYAATRQRLQCFFYLRHREIEVDALEVDAQPHGDLAGLFVTLKGSEE